MPARRDPWPVLTLRGRALLAGGATALVSAFALGQAELVRVGVVVAVLPAVAWLVLGLLRQEVSTTREVAQPVIAAGARCEVSLVVASRSRNASPVLGEEQLPFALGTRPRFVLEDTDASQRVDYVVRSEVRGRFQLGPLTTRTTDPFGLVEVRRTHPGTASITVTPPVVPLPGVSLGAGRGGADDVRSAALAAGSAEDVTVRQYRRGDDLRRVHWLSSARLGELMVRREEHLWEARATIVLDNRASAHRGHGRGCSLETAVSVAASVAVHLDRHGFAVHLVTADGSASSDAESVLPILEHLALVGLSDRADLATGRVRTSHGTVVGVFGALGPGDHGALRTLQRYGDTALAISLDSWQWEHRNAAPSEDSARLLRDLGWRATSLGVHDPIADAWRGLAARQGVRR